MTTKSTTSKTAAVKTARKPKSATTAAAKKTASTKPVAVKRAAVKHEAVPAAKEHEAKKAVLAHQPPATGKYIFATGRRKTSVANVRLFSGQAESMVNKKPFKNFFSYSYYQHDILKPFELTGLGSEYSFVAHVNGGGPHSQAQAVQHGISIALSKLSEEVRKVLKKNGLLTRDDRKKERKKPGLKRARRSPQWAKR
ncbi:MAG: 30S ribosomal protein S9 [Patescibacteria group bacterium]|nr:30S ribosomal protein S9 [Patescibacteria group bacterium]